MPDPTPDRLDPRRARAWRLVLVAALCAVLAWALRQWQPWAPALLFGAAWTSAALFLLLDTALRRVWAGYLILTAGILLLAGADPAGRIIVVALNFCFLLLRRYRPWRLLSSAQRAGAFGLGLAALILSSWDWHWSDPEALGRFTGLGNNLARACQGSLRLFWIFSLLRLLFGMRLHFLRLRPKLTVAALLIAALPLLLLTAFGLVALYGAMGGVTTSRGRDVLQDWAAHPEAIPAGAAAERFAWSGTGAEGPVPVCCSSHIRLSSSR